MSGLNSLKLVSSKPIRKYSPCELRRSKLCKKLIEQLEMARRMKAGEPFEVMVRKSVQTTDLGEFHETQRPKKIKPWWWSAEDGKMYLTVRYGARPLELAKGCNAVETDGIDGVIKTLEVIKIAVQSGELDDQIERLSNTSTQADRNIRQTLTLRKSH